MSATLDTAQPDPPGAPRTPSLGRDAFELLPDAVYLVRSATARGDSVILDCNRAACEQSGYSREELVGARAQIIVAMPVDREERARVTHMLEHGGRLSYANLRRQKDGSLYGVETTLATMVVDGEQLVLAVDRLAGPPAPSPLQEAFLERERLLQASLERQARADATYAQCLQALHQPADDHAARVRALAAVIRALRDGIAAAEVGLYALRPGPDGAPQPILLAQVNSADELLLSDGAPLFGSVWRAGGDSDAGGERAAGAAPVPELEGRTLLPIGDSARLWGWLAVLPPPGRALDDQERRLVTTLGEVLSIVVRRWLAADQLVANEQRLRLALDAADLGFWEWNIATGEVLISDHAARSLDVESPAVTSFSDLLPRVHPEDRSELLQLLPLTPETAAAFRREVRVVTREGEVRSVLIHGRPCAGPPESGTRIIGVAADITALRAAERELRVAASDRDLLLSRLQLVLDRTPIGVILNDPDFTVTYWNPAAERIFGWTRDEIIGRSPYDMFIGPSSRAYVEEIQRRLAAGDNTAHGENENLTKDGRSIICEWYNTPLHNAEGDLIGFLAMAQDVTARHAAEERALALQTELEERVRERTHELERANRALSSQQRFLDRLIESSPSKVYIWDNRTLGIVYSSLSYERMLGYTREELERIGGDFPVPALLHPDDLASIPEQVRHQMAMADDEIYAREYRLRHADGSWRWYVTYDVIFERDAAGVPVQILGQVLDISERKQVEQDLAEASAQLQELNARLQRSTDLLTTVINSLDDGLALIGPDEVVLMANSALCEIYGKEASAILGRPWSQTCATTLPQVEHSLAAGVSGTGRGRVARGDGKHVTVDYRTFPLTVAGTGVTQLVLHITDITAQLQFEELALQNERLATSGRLAAIVAHEVNSPLQAIQNFLFLAESDDPEERASYLHMISEEIDRVGGLIRRLHEFNRADAGQLRPVDVTALIERVLTLVGNTLARHHIQVTLSGVPELPPVVVRVDHLVQVLLNLILNAMDAMPRGGTLTVSAAARPVEPGEIMAGPSPAQLLTIEVQDSGIGIPEEVLPQIFEPFVTTKVKGSGLGLTICRQIVEQHGGQISARNSRAGGAVFTITLPVAEAATGGE